MSFLPFLLLVSFFNLRQIESLVGQQWPWDISDHRPINEFQTSYVSRHSVTGRSTSNKKFWTGYMKKMNAARRRDVSELKSVPTDYIGKRDLGSVQTDYGSVDGAPKKVARIGNKKDRAMKTDSVETNEHQESGNVDLNSIQTNKVDDSDSKENDSVQAQHGSTENGNISSENNGGEVLDDDGDSGELVIKRNEWPKFLRNAKLSEAMAFLEIEKDSDSTKFKIEKEKEQWIWAQQSAIKSYYKKFKEDCKKRKAAFYQMRQKIVKRLSESAQELDAKIQAIIKNTSISRRQEMLGIDKLLRTYRRKVRNELINNAPIIAPTAGNKVPSGLINAKFL